MKNNESKGATGGIGFVGLLTIVFITLKLLGKSHGAGSGC